MIFHRPAPWKREGFKIVDAIGTGVLSFEDHTSHGGDPADCTALLDRIVAAINHVEQTTTPREINL